MKCIFCLTQNPLLFNTKEHILPESLGGGDWAILPSGLYCDNCQNKFGSTIEQQALADYPFNNLRVFLGIPTKKKKLPWFKYWEGELHSTGEIGTISYLPNEFFKESFESGKKIHTIIPSVSKKPDMILRTLLKIGLEVIAANDKELVFDTKFDAARNYALLGVKQYPWFYIQKENHQHLNLYLKGEIYKPTFMDVHYHSQDLIYLHMGLHYLEFVTPLTENVVLEDGFKLEEPDERVFII